MSNDYKKLGLKLITSILLFIGGIIIGIIAIFCIVPILGFSSYLNSGIEWKYDPIAITSINIGILQTFIAIIGIGLVIAAYFNFTIIKDKLKEVDKKLIEHDEKIKKYKKPDKKMITKEKQEED